MKSLFQKEKIKLQLFEKRIVRFRNISLKGVERGASSQGTRFDFPPPPAGYRRTWISLSSVLWDFADAWQIDPGTATPAFRRIRPVETLTIQPCHLSSLSLSLSRVQRAIFFFIPFFFPPRTSSRELVMVGSRWNCSFSREREEEARRWWFIVPSRDSLNWGGDFGIFFFLSLESRREKKFQEFFVYFYTTVKIAWKIVTIFCYDRSSSNRVNSSREIRDKTKVLLSFVRRIRFDDNI